jgi:hypothetical protein
VVGEDDWLEAVYEDRFGYPEDDFDAEVDRDEDDE